MDRKHTQLERVVRRTRSYFLWNLEEWEEKVHTYLRMHSVRDTADMKEVYKAPTAQEVLEDLYDRWRKPLLWIYPNAWRRTVQLDEYWEINDYSPQRNEENITEWVAKYWLRCKENKLI